MNDDDLLQPPTEREVSPQLRARVLQQALDPMTSTRPRRLFGPALAGLAAAAVVTAVIIAVTARDDHPGHDGVNENGNGSNAAGHDPSPARVVRSHHAVDVDKRQLTQAEASAAKAACLARMPRQELGMVLAARLQESPMGVPVPVIGYQNATHLPEYLCTPYQIVQNSGKNQFTSRAHPLSPIEGSRVQLRVATTEAGVADTYVDGSWFASARWIAAIEVRVNVGGDLGEWYSSSVNGGFLFASGWRTLTPDQLGQPVEVEYRAITADDHLVRVPQLSHTVVVPDSVDVSSPDISALRTTQ